LFELISICHQLNQHEYHLFPQDQFYLLALNQELNKRNNRIDNQMVISFFEVL